MRRASSREPGSSNFSIRSRAVYLPRACCLATAGPSACAASWRNSSSFRQPLRVAVRRVLGHAPDPIGAWRTAGAGPRRSHRARRSARPLRRPASIAAGAGSVGSSMAGWWGGRIWAHMRARRPGRGGSATGSRAGGGAICAVRRTRVPKPLGSSSTAPAARSLSHSMLDSGVRRVIVISAEGLSEHAPEQSGLAQLGPQLGH